ncbi:protein kinase activating protein dpb11, partial [Coemansia sp. RSA 2703]
MSPTRGSHTPLPGTDLLGPVSADCETIDISHILDGVVIALSSRLYYMRNELAPLALSMGCRFLSSFDTNQATHLVHQSPRERETAKDYRAAVQNGILVVSPLWLSACQQAMQRVPETDFPYNFQLRRRLDQLSVVSSKPPKPSVVGNAVNLKRSRTPAQGELCKKGLSDVKTIDTTEAHNDSRPNVAQRQKGDSNLKAISGIDSAVSSENPSPIDRLSDIKAMRTQRRYRQTATRIAGSTTRDDWSIKEPGASAASDARDNSINTDSYQMRRSLSSERSSTSAGESDMSHKCSVATRSLSASAVLPTARTDAVATGDSLKVELHSVSRQSGVQTPNKWWLSSDQPLSAGYSSANNMHLYSQDFQLSGNKSLDSMPNTGEPNDTQAVLGSVTRMTMSIAPRLAGQSVSQVSRLSSMDEVQRDRITSKTDEALQPGQQEKSATNPNPAGSPSSPTRVQKTMIIYEDTKALSER